MNPQKRNNYNMLAYLKYFNVECGKKYLQVKRNADCALQNGGFYINKDKICFKIWKINSPQDVLLENQNCSSLQRNLLDNFWLLSMIMDYVIV